MSGDALRRLAERCGIQLRWTDWKGREHSVTDGTLAALLAAMGYDASDAGAMDREATRLEEAAWRRVLPPLSILPAGDEPRVEFTVLRPLLPAIRVTLDGEHGEVSWEVDPAGLQEAGERVLGDLAFSRRVLPLPALAPGRYRLALATGDGRFLEQTSLVVVPERCRQPDPARRTWGLAIQLYALRSARNWGIGDFTDLADLAGPAAALGADFIGVSPLHALFPAMPEACSPYSPCHRRFLNVLFIDPEAVPEQQACAEARGRVARPAFQARLAALRESEQVDYAGVAAAKDEILRLAWEHFRDGADPARRRDFEAFLDAGGGALRDLGAFYAIHRHFTRAGRTGGFPAWPAGYEHSRAPGSLAFARDHAAEIDYQCWLQWVADGQLAATRAAMRRAGMSIGLYEDLAVGADPGGAETWSEPGLHVTGAAIGAPPDPLASAGQDWGLPPVSPVRLRERAAEPLRTLLAAVMGRAGALRLDHVMGLSRLWWVPAGRPPEEGAYVSYPLDALLGLVALESARAGCIVVGEDLGTVPDALRQALAQRGVLSYRVLLFERDEEGGFLAPERYPGGALVTAATHDMPTLTGWWRGRDLEMEIALHGRGGEAARYEERRRERALLLEALAGAGLMPDAGREAEIPAAEVVSAVQRFLATSPAVMLALRPEDWLGIDWPANVPGTVCEYPNWRRKLPVDLPGLLGRPRVRELAAAITRARAGDEPGAPPGDGGLTA